jgi:hypothetical protein
LRQRLYGVGVSAETVMLAVASGAAALLICVVATVVPLKVALGRMESFEG